MPPCRALLSLEGSYHGNSLAGLSVGASDKRTAARGLDILARSI